jgi:hypothetical protein
MENLQAKLYIVTRTTYFVDIDMPCLTFMFYKCVGGGQYGYDTRFFGVQGGVLGAYWGLLFCIGGGQGYARLFGLLMQEISGVCIGGL